MGLLPFLIRYELLINKLLYSIFECVKLMSEWGSLPESTYFDFDWIFVGSYLKAFVRGPRPALLKFISTNRSLSCICFVILTFFQAKKLDLPFTSIRFLLKYKASCSAYNPWHCPRIPSSLLEDPLGYVGLGYTFSHYQSQTSLARLGFLESWLVQIMKWHLWIPNSTVPVDRKVMGGDYSYWWQWQWTLWHWKYKEWNRLVLMR